MHAPHLVAPRILFYAVNGLGLGHVTRLLAIARAVRRERPEAQILFLTTSEADAVIAKEGFAAIKLPSKNVIASSRLQPAVFTKLAHTVVLNTVAAFNPAILVADTYPAGAAQELLSTLSWAMRRVFVFRAQKEERARDLFFQGALARYDLCLIPHPEGSEEIPVPASVRTVWTGDIFLRARSEAWSREKAREYLGLPAAGKVLYVTFGGGGDEELASALETTLDATTETAWILAVADAPLGRIHLPVCSGKVFRISHYPMAECFPAFDGAVSAAGYNTVNELLHFGVPSILIPFPRGLDDQFARVRRLVHAGAVLTSELKSDDLRAALKKLSDPEISATLREKSQSLVAESGAGRAAEAILALL
ncbi:MAG TPA: glycosyltransferase [Capsulimonadaceae bacterium]|nr:glycosyltransferase [Capsulimonadaceae bacterium]